MTFRLRALVPFAMVALVACGQGSPGGQTARQARAAQSAGYLRVAATVLTVCGLNIVMPIAPAAMVRYADLERNAFTLVMSGSFISFLYSGDSTAISAVLPSALL